MLVAGVCAAVARHLGLRVRSVRLLALVLTLAGGSGPLLYGWLWAFTPHEPAATPAEADTGARREVPGAALLLVLAVAAALLTLIAAPSAGERLPGGALETIVASSAAVAWSLGLDRGDPTRSARYGFVVRTASAALLLLVGTALLLQQPWVLTTIAAVLMLTLGVVVLLIPRVVELWSEVIAERSGRVREEQRAEIAAHLHDSVLQTLALIQNRAEPQSEIARLARAQERELREWLFAEPGVDPGDLAVELQRYAAELELEYPVRFEVVTVGEAALSSGALAGAAREAMLNAARHAGGEVSVYLEASPEELTVFIRDHGPGFDPAVVEEGRLGVRESIIGRMTRSGGAAAVRSSVDGTEIELRGPRA